MKNWFYGKHVVNILFTRYPHLVKSVVVIENTTHANDSILKKFLVKKISKKNFIANFPDFKATIAVNISQVPTTDFQDLLKQASSGATNKIILVLDQIHNPSNLGSMLRTAYAAGVFGVIIRKTKNATLNHTVAKTSSGALFLMKIALVANINSSIRELKKTHFWIVATSMTATMEYSNIDFADRNLAILVGNEGAGIGQLLLRESDYLVKIPMKPGLDSLNVSVATAIILYEIRKKQNFWKPRI